MSNAVVICMTVIIALAMIGLGLLLGIKLIASSVKDIASIFKRVPKDPEQKKD